MALVACGGDGASISATSIHGTVASGAGLEATIVVVDSGGDQAETSSDADGKYSVEMAGKSGPFIIKATAKSGDEVHFSYSASFGVANVTELTTLAMTLAKDVDLNDEFSNWNTHSSSWKRSDIEEGIAKVNANFAADLEEQGLDAKKYDFFVEEFETNEKGIDAILKSYVIVVDTETQSVEVKDDADSDVVFNADISTDDYLIGAIFDVAADSQWTLTYTIKVNGVGEPVSFSLPVSGEDVPYNEPRFLEDGFSLLSDSIFEIESEDGSIKLSVLDYSTNYSSTGDGAVGSTITGSISYKYRISYNIAGRSDSQDYEYYLEIKYERTS